MSADTRDEIKALILEHFTEGAHAGSSWRLNPGAAADAIIARFPYISADQSLYDYAASLRQQLLDTRAELEKEKTR